MMNALRVGGGGGGTTPQPHHHHRHTIPNDFPFISGTAIGYLGETWHLDLDSYALHVLLHFQV